MSPVLAGGFLTTEPPRKPHMTVSGAQKPAQPISHTFFINMCYSQVKDVKNEAQRS